MAFKLSKLKEESFSADHLPAEILDYVKDHYSEDISLKKMAKNLGYNYSYLSSFFNDNLQISFIKLVNQYRISHATNLLKNSRYSITEISTLCGFSTIRSFNRVFKAQNKMTPSEFRKEN